MSDNLEKEANKMMARYFLLFVVMILLFMFAPVIGEFKNIIVDKIILFVSDFHGLGEKFNAEYLKK